MEHEENVSRDFIRNFVDEDLKSGKCKDVKTRFPPEPNGYLHIGHAKAICIDFGVAKDFGGVTNLRFDDTNPIREEQEFVDAIKRDIKWLGFDWADREYYASDYFEQLFEWAVKLIEKGLAYVDDQTAEEMRQNRGTLTQPGVDSPFRDRSIEENLRMFKAMRDGEFPDGSHVLRAKIDMASSNLNLRDPAMYRIMRARHHRTGEKWCIYPMYDWAHGQSDSLENVTHSLCDLDFENHRPLYNWFIEQLEIFPTRQIEFARGNITHMITSKRKLVELVKNDHVNGWDDPRMPTLCGLRRRGFTAASIRRFWKEVGIAKRENNIDIALLEHCLREELNKTAPRVMAVLNPLKVTITNYPEGEFEELDAVNNPEDAAAGTRKLPFDRELFIERDDFMEDPPRKFFRLGPGREVRLRWAYFLKCEDFVKNEDGEVIELICTYDKATKGGNSPDGRKVKGTIHWVSARHAVKGEVRLYDKLFSTEKPGDISGDYIKDLNPDSLQVLNDCCFEPGLAEMSAGAIMQFERIGYFCADPDSSSEKPVFNRAVGLRDSWAKAQKKK
jgi:glutaminyl-tRNA synthetase